MSVTFPLWGKWPASPLLGPSRRHCAEVGHRQATGISITSPLDNQEDPGSLVVAVRPAPHVQVPRMGWRGKNHPLEFCRFALGQQRR